MHLRHINASAKLIVILFILLIRNNLIYAKKKKSRLNIKNLNKENLKTNVLNNQIGIRIFQNFSFLVNLFLII